MKVLVFIGVIAAWISFCPPVYSWDDESGDGFSEEKQSVLGKELLIGGFGGMNDPRKGYNGYRSNPFFGLDVSLLLSRYEKIQSYGSVSCVFLPLAAPVEINEFSDNIFALHINYIAAYEFNSKFSPYAGLGLGYYWNFVSQKDPIVGTKSKTNTYGGFNVSCGIMYKLFPRISIAPQYSVYYILQPGIKTQISTYSLKFIYYIFPKKAHD